jgi:hypothetical protein
MQRTDVAQNKKMKSNLNRSTTSANPFFRSAVIRGYPRLIAPIRGLNSWPVLTI